MTTPSRPPPSNALWGQLLRKNTLAVPATVPLPPTAPLDKTGTSMRILLHDTQANFENFSTRVDTLTSGIENAKREIVVVKDLFQGAQESLTNDVVDLVNRSQTQIQKSLGSPAQATALDLFRKDVDVRLDGLSKRIDDMQSFNQTQSQALQNVIQALQSLQEQQGKILSAVLPLLPLLQAVPSHVDSARSSINETMLRVSLESIRNHRTPPHLWPQPPQVIRKRSFPAGPLSSPLLARKRPRLDDERLESDHIIPKSMNGDYSNGYRSPKAGNRRPGSSYKGPFFLTGPGCPPVSRSSASTHRTFSLTKPTVPRRPLGDLPLPQNTDSRDAPSIRSPASPKDLSTRAPLIPPSLARIIPQPEHLMTRTPSLRDSPSRYGSSRPDTPERLELPVASSPSPTAPSSPSPPPIVPAPPVALAHVNGTDPKPSTIAIPLPLLPEAAVSHTMSSTIAVPQHPAPPPARVTMVRGRRSPFRDGRRFIPLDDDDDSDSDED
ncbi:hypothetical protein C8F04DRAFT_1068854 [Mycena alexandri]|uniref:Uncharacterized protein n=1 Tax=Mycena alexandri TaxID=1745969 RepID=A0AAD6XE40_9AGAR|nr:hypothetical protein C8F04DRAFT_1068854 [Mycena alexandri]